MQHLLPPLRWSWEVTGDREASPRERAPWQLSKGTLLRVLSELAGAQPAQEQQAGPIQQCPCLSLAVDGCEAWKGCWTLAFSRQFHTWEPGFRFYSSHPCSASGEGTLGRGEKLAAAEVLYTLWPAAVTCWRIFHVVVPGVLEVSKGWPWIPFHGSMC